MSLTCQICEQPLCPVSDDLWVVEGVLVHYGCVEHKHSVLQSEEDTPRVEPAPAPETHDERAGELVHYDCADLPKEPASTGLGDRVEKVAQPIAKLIDDVFNTDIQNCGGCKSRKKWLNDRFPK